MRGTEADSGVAALDAEFVGGVTGTLCTRVSLVPLGKLLFVSVCLLNSSLSIDFESSKLSSNVCTML